MTNRGIIMVSVAIKCEAVRGSSVYVACICQEIHDGLLVLTSGMFIHIFNEEEMNDIN
jgi:hypothetical protein